LARAATIAAAFHVGIL
jgi:hypothetical protein